MAWVRERERTPHEITARLVPLQEAERQHILNALPQEKRRQVRELLRQSPLHDTGAGGTNDTDGHAEPAPWQTYLVKGMKLGSPWDAGGSGLIYDHPQDRERVIKVLHRYDEKDKERFRREYKILQGLKHESIVRVYDAGDTEDASHAPYFEMERVPGTNLDSGKDMQKPPFASEEILWIFQRLADALRYVHAEGLVHKEVLVHRDIKEKNVMYDPVTKRVVLLDFGIARPVNNDQTDTGSGTVGYVAPDGNSTPLGDIFSLGVTMGHLLGKERTEDDSQRKRLRCVADKCAQPDPEKRYRSAAQLAHALRLVAAGEDPKLAENSQLPSGATCPPAFGSRADSGGLQPEVQPVSDRPSSHPPSRGTRWAGWAHGLCVVGADLWRGLWGGLRVPRIVALAVLLISGVLGAIAWRAQRPPHGAVQTPTGAEPSTEEQVRGQYLGAAIRLELPNDPLWAQLPSNRKMVADCLEPLLNNTALPLREFDPQLLALQQRIGESYDEAYQHKEAEAAFDRVINVLRPRQEGLPRAQQIALARAIHEKATVGHSGTSDPEMVKIGYVESMNTWVNLLPANVRSAWQSPDATNVSGEFEKAASDWVQQLTDTKTEEGPDVLSGLARSYGYLGDWFQDFPSDRVFSPRRARYCYLVSQGIRLHIERRCGDALRSLAPSWPEWAQWKEPQAMPAESNLQAVLDQDANGVCRWLEAAHQLSRAEGNFLGLRWAHAVAGSTAYESYVRDVRELVTMIRRLLEVAIALDSKQNPRQVSSLRREILGDLVSWHAALQGGLIAALRLDKKSEEAQEALRAARAELGADESRREMWLSSLELEFHHLLLTKDEQKQAPADAQAYLRGLIDKLREKFPLAPNYCSDDQRDRSAEDASQEAKISSDNAPSVESKPRDEPQMHTTTASPANGLPVQVCLIWAALHGEFADRCEEDAATKIRQQVMAFLKGRGRGTASLDRVVSEFDARLRSKSSFK